MTKFFVPLSMCFVTYVGNIAYQKNKILTYTYSDELAKKISAHVAKNICADITPECTFNALFGLQIASNGNYFVKTFEKKLVNANNPLINSDNMKIFEKHLIDHIYNKTVYQSELYDYDKLAFFINLNDYQHTIECTELLQKTGLNIKDHHLPYKLSAHLHQDLPTKEIAYTITIGENKIKYVVPVSELLN